MSADELSFVRSHLGRIAPLDVAFLDAFATPPAAQPRRPHLVAIELAPPPGASSSVAAPLPSSSSSSDIQLNIKSLKPPLQFTLAASPLDPISALKTALHAARPDAVPPPAYQRLLVKGKALADASLLREYGLGDGDGVVLAIKPGWAAAPDAPPPPPLPSDPAPEADPTAAPGAAVPVLTLSDPSSTVPHALAPEAFSTPTALPPTEAHYHAVVARPAFWQALDAFLKGQFGELADAEKFWETTLLAQKRSLKEGEVALIRDRTGYTAMGGGPA